MQLSLARLHGVLNCIVSQYIVRDIGQEGASESKAIKSYF